MGTQPVGLVVRLRDPRVLGTAPPDPPGGALGLRDASEPSPAAGVSPKAKRVCPSCSRVLSATAHFCVGCGAELPAGETPVEVEVETEVVLAGVGEEPEGMGEAVEQVEVEEEAPPALVSPAPVAPPVEPPAPPPTLPVAGAMVAAATEMAAPQFDRYAGTGPETPPPPEQPRAPVARPEPRPDVSLRGAFHRLARRGPWSAATVCGLLAMAGVALIGLGLGLLVRAAHGSQGCAVGALTGSLQGGCYQPGSTNGVLTDWNAMLWSIQGVGVAFTGGDGGGLVVRIPLGLGMLLTILVVALAGAACVRLVPPRKLGDIALRAAAIALAYTVGMMLLGIAVTARGDHVSVGPDDGLLLLWGLFLGFTGALAGMFQQLFGSPLPLAPRAMLAARLGSWAGIVEAAVVGTAAALLLGMLLGVVAAATHPGDTSNALHAALADVTTRPLPSSPTGTIASVVYLVLGLPTLATWVLAYSLIIPTVTLGTALGYTDYGLLAGDHDAWLWAAVVLPVVVTLLAGYVAARRRRSSSVEAALLDGAIGGLGFVALAFLTVVLLDGGATLSPSRTGGIPGGVSGTGFLLGPGLQYTLGALLLWGVVGGAVGGYLSLLFLVRGIRPPFLRRYDIEPPPVPSPPACPSCGVVLTSGARFCSACGAGLDPAPPG